MNKLIAGLMLATAPWASFAQDSDAKLRAAFAEVGLKVNSVADSVMPGVQQVLTDKGLFFSANHGQYLIEGQVYDLSKKQMVNDNILRPVRQAGVAKLADSAIEYKAKNEKYRVTVFTDTSCGYCRKLHSDMQSYLDAGITVRYLAFPRGGVQSETFEQLQGIWCAKDQQKAMNQAKAGGDVALAACPNNVEAQYELGQSFGISGTPALVLPDGSLIPGYQTAEQLSAALARLAKS